MTDAQNLIGALLRLETELSNSLDAMPLPEIIELRRRVVFDGPMKIIDDAIARRMNQRCSGHCSNCEPRDTACDGTTSALTGCRCHVKAGAAAEPSVLATAFAGVTAARGGTK